MREAEAAAARDTRPGRAFLTDQFADADADALCGSLQGASAYSDTGGDGTGGTAGPQYGGAGPQYDARRKLRDLKLEGFKALLGPWQNQLFVSIMGLLPVYLSHMW